MAHFIWEQPTRLRILWGENPLPSIARFGRLAYPGRGEVTNHGVLGWKRHGCLEVLQRNREPAACDGTIHLAGEISAVGVTGMASKPTGLNRREWLQPRK